MPTDSGSQDSAGRKTTAAASSEPSALNREGIDGVRLSGFACRELGLQGTVVGEAPAMHLLDLLGRRLLLKQAHGVAKLSQGVVLELLGRAVAGAIHLRLGRDQLVQELALAVLLARLRVRLRHREGLPERAAALGSDHDHSRARRSLEDELPFLRREVSLSRHRHSFGRLFLFRWATPARRSCPLARERSRSLALEHGAVDVDAITSGDRHPVPPYTRDARESGGILRSATLQVDLERRVVAEPLLAPCMVIDGRNGVKLLRCEEVIETPTAVVTGNAPPGPARLAVRVALQRSERVAVAELSQPWDDAELGVVPLGSTLGPQAASGVARERDHLAVGKLPARGVEISAEHPRTPRRGRQPAADRLQRSNLDPAVGGVRNVDAVELEGVRAHG